MPTFPNARYVMPQGELDFFATPEADNRRIVFDDSVAPVIAAGQSFSIDVAGGNYLEFFHFLPMPGHSFGHMAISLTSQGETAIFTGDIMHSPMQVYRPHWNSVFCRDQELARESRRWLLDYASERSATLFTAHFGDSSAGVVSRQNGAYEWWFL